MRGLFITGSDTGVGKTQIGCAIAAKLNALGQKIIPRKPVESGCEIQDGKLFAKDANSLKIASNTQDSLDTICPFKFPQEIAPPQAATAQGIKLKLQDLTNSCQVTDDGFVIVEGAGGWLSPIAHDGSNADLATKLKLEVVLVVEYKLGCINQTLLSLESIMHKNLGVYKIYLNQTSKDQVNPQDFEYLKSMVDIPIIKIAYTPKPDSWQKIKQTKDLI